MRIIAPMMILIMMTSTLAGCTGGDPDGGGNDEINMDILNQLIDDNLQDFVNNTTITVENHYHNNTTIINDNTDNSVSNINGSGSISTLKMFTVEWNYIDYLKDEHLENPGERIVTLTEGNNNSTNGVGDNSLLFSYGYNGYVIELRLNCREYMHYEYYWDWNEWEDWLIDNYGYNNNAGDIASDIYYDIRNNWNSGFSASAQCSMPSSGIWNENRVYVDDILLYEIELEEGEAISIIVNGPDLTTDVNCVDGYGTGVGNGTSTSYIGGQSECTVSGYVSSLSYYSVSFTSDIYDIYVGRYMTDYRWFFDSITPESFAVYFTLNQVEVHDFED